MLILSLALVVAAGATAAVSLAPFARTPAWRATVTPLASIIGSGFLICGPLLAKEFGAGAIWAEALLLAIAYAVGAVMRFNIRHAEPHLAELDFHDRLSWLARVSQAILALAYAISVAYYLKLLAEFGLRYAPLPTAWRAPASNLVVSGLIAGLGLLAVLGDLGRAERLAHASVALKLGAIAGMLAALAAYGVLHGPSEPPPPARFSVGGATLLLGLLITVQGFETSRYLGHAYPADLRIRTMRHAQWISSAVYLAFLVLLWPLLARATRTSGVAGILDVMGTVAPFLGVLVLVGAVSSQLSAATADSIGAAGLLSEASRRRLPVRWAFAAALGLSLLIVWATDPFQVIALSSRAFALFYLLQCMVALWTARRLGRAGPLAQLGFVAVAIVCFLAAATGAPAE